MLQKKWKKFLSFCGDPLFVEAPVRPNMLNMPKSASAYRAKSLPCHTFSETGKFPESSEWCKFIVDHWQCWKVDKLVCNARDLYRLTTAHVLPPANSNRNITPGSYV